MHEYLAVKVLAVQHHESVATRFFSLARRLQTLLVLCIVARSTLAFNCT
jgi:hypothetical protein